MLTGYVLVKIKQKTEVMRLLFAKQAPAEPGHGGYVLLLELRRWCAGYLKVRMGSHSRAQWLWRDRCFRLVCAVCLECTVSLSVCSELRRKRYAPLFQCGRAASAYNFSGNINGSYEIGCELQRKRIECAIMIKAALADEEKENEL